MDEEQVDLTEFAGKKIMLRFEMVTDDAVNQPGLLMDNISIPEIGYPDDGESGVGGWDAVGWRLTDNSLAQRWLVQLMEIGGGQVTVQRMAVGPEAAVSSPCEPGRPGRSHAGHLRADAGDDGAGKLQLHDHAAVERDQMAKSK